MQNVSAALLHATCANHLVRSDPSLTLGQSSVDIVKLMRLLARTGGPDFGEFARQWFGAKVK